MDLGPQLLTLSTHSLIPLISALTDVNWGTTKSHHILYKTLIYVHPHKVYPWIKKSLLWCHCLYITWKKSQIWHILVWTCGKVPISPNFSKKKKTNKTFLWCNHIIGIKLASSKGSWRVRGSLLCETHKHLTGYYCLGWEAFCKSTVRIQFVARISQM